MARALSRVSVGDWPRLTRFYGIGPEELVRLPGIIIKTYAEQLPFLEGEEMLRDLIVADYPHVAQKDRTIVWARARQLAFGGEGPADSTPVDLKTAQGRSVLSAHGIGFRGKKPEAVR